MIDIVSEMTLLFLPITFQLKLDSVALFNGLNKYWTDSNIKKKYQKVKKKIIFMKLHLEVNLNKIQLSHLNFFQIGH